VSEWISVTDRLPKEYEVVLVWDRECVGIDTCDDPRTERRGQFGLSPTVTHWMPLPEPPK
jgi:hypothetical protein